MSVASEIDDEAGVSAGPELLPLDGWHRARGGRMVEFAGYAMPVQYEGIIAEHLWTRENAGLFDVSHMGQLLVSGDEAQAALEALLPADLASLGLGALRYSLLLAEDGGILDDLIAARWPGGFYLVVNGATNGTISPICAKICRMKSRSTISTIARCWPCRVRRPSLCWSATPAANIPCRSSLSCAEASSRLRAAKPG